MKVPKSVSPKGLSSSPKLKYEGDDIKVYEEHVIFEWSLRLKVLRHRWPSVSNMEGL